jgi:hypothetical protein
MGRTNEFHIPAERKVFFFVSSSSSFFFSSAPPPDYLDWLWSPPRNGYRGYFLGGKVAKA